MATYSIWCGVGGTSVQAQTAVFGAATLVGAGGFKPVSLTGYSVSLASYNSLVSGSLGGYTPAISGGALVFSGAAGAPSGAVLRCGLSGGGTVDITISTQANTYSVATVAEIQAALSAVGSAGGKTILVRRGEYSTAPVGTIEFGKNVSYVAEVNIVGEGTADTGKGARFTPYISISSANKLRYTNVEVSSPTGWPAPFEVSGTSTDTIIEDCWIHGKYYNPMVASGVDYSNCNGITLEGASVSGTIIRRNLITHVNNGISVSVGASAFTIDLNEIKWYTADAIQIGLGSPSSAVRQIHRNVIYAPLYTLAETHSDAIQFTGIAADATQANTNITIRQNVIFNCPAQSLGTFAAGPCAFVDTSSPAWGRQLTGMVFAGNVIAISNNNAAAFSNVSSGYFGYNTIVSSDTSGTNTPQLSLGSGQSAGTVVAKHNANDGQWLQGAATYTTANNVTLGGRGTTISYTTAFNWANPAVAAANYNELMANLTPKSGGPLLGATNAGAIGTGYCTFGQPRNATGWTYDAGLEV